MKFGCQWGLKNIKKGYKMLTFYCIKTNINKWHMIFKNVYLDLSSNIRLIHFQKRKNVRTEEGREEWREKGEEREEE